MLPPNASPFRVSLHGWTDSPPIPTQDHEVILERPTIMTEPPSECTLVLPTSDTKLSPSTDSHMTRISHIDQCSSSYPSLPVSSRPSSTKPGIVRPSSAQSAHGSKTTFALPEFSAPGNDVSTVPVFGSKLVTMTGAPYSTVIALTVTIHAPFATPSPSFSFLTLLPLATDTEFTSTSILTSAFASASASASTSASKSTPVFTSTSAFTKSTFTSTSTSTSTSASTSALMFAPISTVRPSHPSINLPYFSSNWELGVYIMIWVLVVLPMLIYVFWIDVWKGGFFPDDSYALEFWWRKRWATWRGMEVLKDDEEEGKKNKKKKQVRFITDARLGVV
ncbi:hypothetical protein K504DRAFT_448522 [Pleomassaria siparia CBS 279.74]|uniref:Uncharacterized protein n=1 Tax=Pleomassaria siparia CBS 279.74 TaxID=1314801 RepID=A0A6G1JXW3_9PLEO|nr:hypothetical protein K504DRAFT_448522 [Pleomassaria siparia CBS 279.74]